ncbi:hypothetical protein [Synechococcus sp. EJ6-Ellesmere]|uniref:hypothetical protein n=1 Tax=Synechococcus sp. EJ6-Ellesmere TaxID=2823734 RepID=UPI0020CDBF9F|nr:hypothetical protein [Synechococcus sp. EJ6-Ellesmere]MCP9823853.1 hypothetical protein [Synechococcus sp. EJ6-Ellesmere]
MCPGKRRALPDKPDGWVEKLVEAAKAHTRSKGENPFRVIKQQFGFLNTRLRGMTIPQQDQCAGSTDQFILGPPPTVADKLQKESVYPLGNDQNKRPGKITLRSETVD